MGTRMQTVDRNPSDGTSSRTPTGRVLDTGDRRVVSPRTLEVIARCCQDPRWPTLPTLPAGARIIMNAVKAVVGRTLGGQNTQSPSALAAGNTSDPPKSFKLT